MVLYSPEWFFLKKEQTKQNLSLKALNREMNVLLRYFGAPLWICPITLKVFTNFCSSSNSSPDTYLTRNDYNTDLNINFLYAISIFIKFYNFLIFRIGVIQNTYSLGYQNDTSKIRSLGNWGYAVYFLTIMVSDDSF